MDKRSRIFNICYTVFFVVIIIGWSTCAFFINRDGQHGDVVKLGNYVAVILLCLPLLVLGIGMICGFLKDSFTGIRKCGDELFDEIAEYNVNWGETKEHYQEMVKVINFYYKDGGKVDSTVGKDLKRLYRRREFLNRNINSMEFFSTCISTVGFSICASLLFAFYTSNATGTQNLGYFIVGIILFAISVLSRFNKQYIVSGNGVWKYENEKLKKKIEDAEKAAGENEYKHEWMMLTKRNVMKVLVKKASFASGKKRDALERDIWQLEKLDLSIQDTTNFKEYAFAIGNSKYQGVLYMDEYSNMANSQYEKLYEILRKYNLIYVITT